MELRTLTLPAELRATRQGDKLRLEGLAIPYRALSVDLGGFRERILPGAFDASLAGPDELFGLLQHAWHYPLARTGDGSLLLASTQEGVTASFLMDDDEDTRWVWQEVKDRNLTGMSFCFRTQPGGDEWAVAGRQVTRSVVQGTLYEVSIVTSPAYPQTRVDVYRAPTKASTATPARRSRWFTENKRRRLRLMEML